MGLGSTRLPIAQHFVNGGVVWHLLALKRCLKPSVRDAYRAQATLKRSIPIFLLWAWCLCRAGAVILRELWASFRVPSTLNGGPKPSDVGGTVLYQWLVLQVRILRLVSFRRRSRPPVWEGRHAATRH